MNDGLLWRAIRNEGERKYRAHQEIMPQPQSPPASPRSPTPPPILQQEDDTASVDDTANIMILDFKAWGK